MSPEEIQIKSVLQELYNLSSSARGVLERSVAQGDLWLFRSLYGSSSLSTTPPSNSAAIDLSDALTRKYFGFDGRVHSFLLDRVVIHELIHGIDSIHDLGDPNSGSPYGVLDRNFNHIMFDHQGETTDLVNQIMEEVGRPVSHGRAAYDVTWDPGDQLNPLSLLDPSLDYAPWTDIELAYKRGHCLILYILPASLSCSWPDNYD